MPKILNARSMSLTSQESYSAVIIADLVAEVQQQPESDRRGSVKVKAETNLSYDVEKASETVAVVHVDPTESVDLRASRANGTDISKGVILNAMQFGQTDGKLKTEIGQPISVCDLPIQVLDTEPKEESLDFKDEFCEMSLLRKIAFAFSFLPSIMFVLCFSVIFPCDKLSSCVQEQWYITYNNTEVTSQLEKPNNIIFTFMNQTESGVMSISESSGETQWEKNLEAPAKFIKCGHLAQPDSQSCLVMDNNGTFYVFDPSNGEILWKLRLDIQVESALPIILSDCNKDGVDEIAVAVSKSEIIVLSQGTINSTIVVQDCNTVPSQLIAWKKINETDLISICQNSGNDVLVKVPQNKWCSGKENTVLPKGNTLLLKEKYNFTQSKILPTENGLLLWTENSVTMLQNNGHQKWMVPNYNHSNNNRFLFYGKINKQKYQVVLFSSDSWANFQVSNLNAENGELIKSTSTPNTELSEAVLLHGEDNDFVLGIKKKFTKSLKSEAVAQIKEMSATVINMLTSEDLEISTSNSSSKILEEISFMELDGTDIQMIQSESLPYLKEDSFTSALTAVSEENNGKNKLRIFILNNPHTQGEKLTSLKSLSVSNWDMSSLKLSQCIWN